MWLRIEEQISTTNYKMVTEFNLASHAQAFEVFWNYWDTFVGIALLISLWTMTYDKCFIGTLDGDGSLPFFLFQN